MNSPNPKYSAVIVEPRNHKALEFVLNNFIENLDDDWQIIIFHGPNNLNTCKEIIEKTGTQKRITFHNLGVNNLTIEEYNHLMITRDFYHQIPTEIFLIFQTDSMIIPINKSNLEPFLKYDYVGAPWIKENLGNGGLSLRRKSKMMEIMDQCLIPHPSIPFIEDLYFSFGCLASIPNKPSIEEAKLFSVEETFEKNPWGVHKPWVLPIEEYEELTTLHPDIETLRILNENESKSKFLSGLLTQQLIMSHVSSRKISK